MTTNTKRELLFSLTKKDFRVQTFRSGGPGGQYQNKVETGVRIIHPASGAVGESRKYASQHQNKGEAFRKLADSKEFKLWIKIKVSELSGETIEQTVEKMMEPKNIKIEVKDESGKWIEWGD